MNERDDPQPDRPWGARGRRRQMARSEYNLSLMGSLGTEALLHQEPGAWCLVLLRP
jgi:hypothetical protein